VFKADTSFPGDVTASTVAPHGERQRNEPINDHNVRLAALH